MTLNHTLSLEDQVQAFLNGKASDSVFFAQLFVALVSICLLAFYTYQYTLDRCLVYPIYVQSITAINYSIGAFRGREIYAALVFLGDHQPKVIMIGRYLSWMITCPAILMGFYQTVGLLGPRISFTTINGIVICDLCLMGLGILGAFQTSSISKGIFITLSCLVSLLVVYDTIRIEHARIDCYTGHLRTWLLGATVLFLASWAIFPILFFLGPPILDMVSFEGDIIAHCIGDLLAKNLFGFVIWNFRFNVIYPFIQEKQSKVAHVVGDAPDLPRNQAGGGMIQYNGPVPGRQGKLKNASHKVLVMEPDVGYQRLFMYLLKEVNCEAVMAFDVKQVRMILARSRLDEFSAVLVNLHQALSGDMAQASALASLKLQFEKPPFFLPIVGFSSSLDDEQALKEERQRKKISHFTALHHLDEKYLGKVLMHFKQECKVWRASSIVNNVDEFALLPPPSRTRDISFSTEEPRDARLERASSFTQQEPPLSPRYLHGGMRRGASTTAIVDTDNPFLAKPKPIPQAPVQVIDPQEQFVEENRVHLMCDSPRSPEDIRCFNNGCPNTGELQCGRCGDAVYCSRECQRNDWVARHNQICR